MLDTIYISEQYTLSDDNNNNFCIKAYMEDHLRNKDRLMKEWEALCSYQAEPSAVSVAQSDANAKKNRCPDSVPCEPPTAASLKP